MTRYARIDNNAPWNPKIEALTDAEFRVWVRSICYADQFCTDGHIPNAALPAVRATKKITTSLVEKGVWEANGNGVHIHDYLEHQRSAEAIKRAIEKARNAGKANSK